MDFLVYTRFFRFFARKPDHPRKEIADFNLVADLASFSEGVAWCYGGRENPALSKLLYNFFSMGTRNHLITLSELVKFVVKLRGFRIDQNRMVFQMLSDHQRQISVQSLLAHFKELDMGS